SVELIKNENNQGFGAANKIGFEKAIAENYEFVFLLNQDAWILEDTLSKMFSAISSQKFVGILSPIHLNGKGDKLDKAFSTYIDYNSNNYFLRDVLFKEQELIYSVPFVNAACWLVNVEVLRKVGLFDNMFFHYGEDNNFCQRTLFHGFDIAICPNSFCYHDREGVQKNLDELEEFKRKVLVKLGDVTFDDLDTYFNDLYTNLKKESFRYLVKAKISNFKKAREKLKFLTTSKEQIEVSRIKNKENG
ncbi:MAG: glycosyltransferase family 2 protein, partial [Nitrososphaeraceae archaeon]|nr:glycosyltransferase family 2 protein [Nitrososphaeraceae archaeon]